MQQDQNWVSASERAELFKDFQKWYSERSHSDLKLQNLLQDTKREESFVLERPDFLLDYSK